MKLLLVALGVIVYSGSVTGQTYDDYRLRQIQRRLDETKSELEEINARESAREKAAQNAEEERLLSLPLDADLQQMYANYARYIYANIKQPKLIAQSIRETKIKMARIQDARNLAR